MTGKKHTIFIIFAPIVLKEARFFVYYIRTVNKKKKKKNTSVKNNYGIRRLFFGLRRFFVIGRFPTPWRRRPYELRFIIIYSIQLCIGTL